MISKVNLRILKSNIVHEIRKGVTCYAQATHRYIYSFFPAFRAPSFLYIIPIYTHIIHTAPSGLDKRFEFTHPSCGDFRGMNDITEDKPGKPVPLRSMPQRRCYYALRFANRFNHRSRRILLRSSSQRGSHPSHLTSAPMLCMVPRLPIVVVTRFRAIKLLLES